MVFSGNKRTISQLLIFVLWLALPCIVIGQGEKKYIREGNREYGKNNFPGSETAYRRALDKNRASSDAVFNTGDALYKQEKFEEAGKQFQENSGMIDDRTKRASAFYNLGNSLLMADKIEESIEAYKNSLRLYPGNMEAKYNLAYAQDLLREQQQQQQQQQQDHTRNNEQNEQKNDDKDQNTGQNQQQQDQQQEQEQQQGISKEDAERLLNAIANDEKNIQEKVKLEKAAKTKVKSLKNW